ncbi:hypothetical protein [Chitinivorax sp. B]|uniref:hypothetical protein n=1 Tax=Chitinivorax sp. B TaxID=2502235 RepID=UPI0010F53309|nr:hypothetical protein [Chitinivorax sp. B]
MMPTVARYCVLLTWPSLLAGCATEAHFERNLDSWLGRQTSELIQAWGSPVIDKPKADGGRVLGYAMQDTVRHRPMRQTVSLNGNAGLIYQELPGSQTATYCVTLLHADAQGVIYNWAWQGNGCQARDNGTR